MTISLEQFTAEASAKGVPESESLAYWQENLSSSWANENEGSPLDPIISVGQGLLGSAEGIYGAADALTGGFISSGTGHVATNAFDTADKYLQENKSQSLQREEREFGQIEGLGESLSYLADNPDLAFNMGAGSLGYMLSLGSATRGIVNKIAQSAKSTALAAGRTQKVADRYGRMVANRSAEKTANTINTGMVGGSSYADASKEVMGMSDEELKATDGYAELKAEGLTSAQIRSDLADYTGRASGLTSALFSAVSTKLSGEGKFIGQTVTKQGQYGKGRIAGAVEGMAREGAQELGESGGEQFGSNVGKKLYLDESQSLSQNVIKQAGVGGILGSVVGGGIGAVAGGGKPEDNRARLQATRNRRKAEVDAKAKAESDQVAANVRAAGGDNLDVVAAETQAASAFDEQVIGAYESSEIAGEKESIEGTMKFPDTESSAIDNDELWKEPDTLAQKDELFSGREEGSTVDGNDVAYDQATQKISAKFLAGKLQAKSQKMKEGLELRSSQEKMVDEPVTNTQLADQLKGVLGTVDAEAVNEVPFEKAVSDGAEGELDLKAEQKTEEIVPEQKTEQFIPTHETSDGEKVVAGEGDNLWMTEDGFEVEDAYASKIESTVDVAAKEAAHSPENNLPDPTEAQKSAGNYKKGAVSLHGLNISIENPKGSIRSGTDTKGNKWENQIKSHYGYVKGSIGADKDHVDVFLGDTAEVADTAYIVDQYDPDTGLFDEHKIMIGYDSQSTAEQAYKENYDKDWKGLGAITPMPMTEFKSWVMDKKKTRFPVVKSSAKPDLKPVVDEKSPKTVDKQDFKPDLTPVGQNRVYHPAVKSYAGELTEGGGIAYQRDPVSEQIIGRTKSTNPDWFKDDAFTVMNVNGTDTLSKSPSVKQIKKAVADYTEGKALTKAQERILEALEEMAIAEETEARLTQEAREAEALSDEELDDILADNEGLDNLLLKMDAKEVYQAIQEQEENENRAKQERQAGSDETAEGSSAKGAEEKTDLLESYSEEELKAKEEKLKAIDKAKAEEERKADEKEKADKEVDDFRLTGSDLPADSNVDQGDIFGAQPKSDQEVDTAANSVKPTGKSGERFTIRFSRSMGTFFGETNEGNAFAANNIELSGGYTVIEAKYIVRKIAKHPVAFRISLVENKDGGRSVHSEHGYEDHGSLQNLEVTFRRVSDDDPASVRSVADKLAKAEWDKGWKPDKQAENRAKLKSHTKVKTLDSIMLRNDQGEKINAAEELASIDKRLDSLNDLKVCISG